jgi:hypothetical protein
MSSGYLKKTCVRVVLFAHLMQIFTPALQASDTDYQYRLKIHTLNLDTEKYQVEVSRRKIDKSEPAQVVQRLDLEQGLVKDHFIRYVQDGQEALYSKFSGAVVKTFEPEHNIRFVYDIPGFGQVQMLKGGKAFFTQAEDNTSLLEYDLAVKSTGALLIANLKLAALILRSQKTDMEGNIVTGSLRVKHEAVNRGKISGDNFDVNGSMINEGAAAFNLLCGDGIFINHRELTLIGISPFLIIKYFYNTTLAKDCPAVITGHEAAVGNLNKSFTNDIDSQILLDRLSFHGELHSGYFPVKDNHDALTQKIMNLGNIQSTKIALSNCLFENAGCLKTTSFEVKESKLRNIAIGSLHIDGSVGGQLTAKESVIENDGGKIYISSGEQGKAKFTQESGRFLNKGLWEQTGDVDLGSTDFTNTGTMVWQNGSFVSTSGKYDNHGHWTLDNMACSQPLDVTNHGTLHFKDGQLTFRRLINENNLIFSAGQYLVTKEFQNNHLMSFLENKWTFTDKAKNAAPHRLVLNGEADDSYNAKGKIESEKRLKHHIGTMPKSVTSNNGVHFSKRHKDQFALSDLKNINTPGKVVFFLSDVNTSKKYKFPNIGHLDLTVDGDCEIYRPFLVPALTLNVNGELTCGSDKHFGTIAATQGPLTVNAHSIDGKHGKFYGAGPTVIKTSVGDIVVGAPQSGGPFLYRQNGAYIASGDTLIVEAAKELKIDYGQIRSLKKQILAAFSKIINTAGDLACMGDVYVNTPDFSNTRAETYNQPVGNWTWAYSGCYNVSESSDQATLRALGTIYFSVDKGYNLASSILAGESILYRPFSGTNASLGNLQRVLGVNPGFNTVGGKLSSLFKHMGTGGYNSNQPATFTSVGRVNWSYGCNDKVGYQQSCSPCGNYPSMLMAGESIKIGLDGFVISGNTNSPLISIQATGSGYFGNSTNTRANVNVQEAIVVNLTEFVLEQARRPGFMRINRRGAVVTDFPMGCPYIPPSGDVVLLQNPEHQPTRKFPINMARFFNPIKEIDLDLIIQQVLAMRAGQVYAGKAKGNQSSRVLWHNAGQAKTATPGIMTEDELGVAPESMLMMEEKEDNRADTLLIIKPKDVNPFQSDGDTVTNKLDLIVGQDLTLENNRIVVLDEEETVIEAGRDINMRTTFHTNEYDVGKTHVIEQVADPQQMILKPKGNLKLKAGRDMNRTGSHVEAGGDVDLEPASRLNEQPLLLQKTSTTKHKSGGLFSSSEHTESTLTHSALPTSTVSGAKLGKKAGTSIHSTAPQDYGEDEIVYDSPDTIVTGLIAADRKQSHSSKSNGFSEQSTSSMQESAFNLPAEQRTGPHGKVTYRGKAQVNANIHAKELHDETDDGIRFVAMVKELLASGQSLSESPLCSIDAGFKAGYETMIPCMLMVEKIVRASDKGEMLFESVLMDDRTEVIGKFVETVYELKQWQTSWCNVEQVIPDEVIIVAAIAVTILTQGAGVKALAPLLKSVTAVTGMTLSTVGIAMVNAGFSAFCSAGTSGTLLSGDLFQVAEQMVSLPQLKSIGISMASAGLCSKLGPMLKINMAPGIKELSMHLKEQALRASVDTVLNVAINKSPVDEALRDAIKQIPLKAVAAYAANQICLNLNDDMGVKAAHTLLGGLAGFAMEGNRDGLVAGATGALAAQVVGDIVLSDAYAIADTAIAQVNENGLPLTPENIEAAIHTEVSHRADLAKIAAAATAALLKKDPNIALFTASNTLDNDITIRQSIYVMAELQKLLQAAAMAEAAQRMQMPVEEEVQKVSASASAQNKEEADQPLVDEIETIKEAEDWADEMMELIDRLRQHVPELHFPDALPMPKEALPKQENEPIMVTFADPDLGSIEMTWEEGVEQLNKSIEYSAFIPNIIGTAVFAGTAAKEIYQSKTTVGEVMFNLVLARVGLGCVRWVGRQVKLVYQSGKSKVIQLTEGLYNKLKSTYNGQDQAVVAEMNKLADQMLGTETRKAANKNRMPFVVNPAAPNHATANYSHLNIVSPWEDGTMFINSRFIGPKDTAMQEILEASQQWVRHNKGPYVVAVHGSEQGVALTKMKATTGKNFVLDNILNKSTNFVLKSEDANWRVLANLIKKNKIYNPEQMKWVNGHHKDRVTVLFSCHGGGEGFAQNLANALGSPVLAPNKILWAFGKEGKFVVAGEQGVGKLSKPDLADVGQFRMFYPGNRAGPMPAPVNPSSAVPLSTGAATPLDTLSKKLASMRNNPKGDWQAADLQYIAERYGINYRQNSTSHVTFSYPQMKNVIAPSRKPIRPVYIKQFLELLDHVVAQQAKK